MTSTTVSRRRGVNTSVAVKAPCRVATTANITLYGEQTIDGVAAVADDRVLVANQTDTTENGIYYVDTGTWTRAEDFDGASDVVEGTLVYVNNGTAGSGWYRVSTTGTITPGTSNITFVSGVVIFQGVVSNADATAITITSDEEVLIGTSNTPSNSNSVTPIAVFSGPDVQGAQQIIRHTTVGSGGAILMLSATRGTDANSYTVLQDGDGIGSLIFSGTDGDEHYVAATIAAVVNGTPSNGSVPCDLKFLIASSEYMRLTSSGDLGIGTSSPDGKLHIHTATAGSVTADSAADDCVVENSGDGGLSILTPNANIGSIFFGSPSDADGGQIRYSPTSNYMSFATGGSEKARINTSGFALFGKTSADLAIEGVEIRGSLGYLAATCDAATAGYFNRLTNDGNLLEFSQANTLEGAISVSGTTITYGSFCGGHWSQLTDNSNPDIPKGTVVSTIDEMCYWEREETTINEEGEEVSTGKIIVEDNDQLVKFKVSDTIKDKRVYGIFSNWDEDGDANIHALGATVVRVTGPCVGGDLLESNGDGTASVQDDDLIHSYTLGKVTFGVPDAGGTDVNLVPVVLYAG